MWRCAATWRVRAPFPRAGLAGRQAGARAKHVQSAAATRSVGCFGAGRNSLRPPAQRAAKAALPPSRGLCRSSALPRRSCHVCHRLDALRGAPSRGGALLRRGAGADARCGAPAGRDHEQPSVRLPVGGASFPPPGQPAPRPLRRLCPRTGPVRSPCPRTGPVRRLCPRIGPVRSLSADRSAFDRPAPVPPLRRASDGRTAEAAEATVPPHPKGPLRPSVHPLRDSGFGRFRYPRISTAVTTPGSLQGS